jgi:hypothetical protein
MTSRSPLSSLSIALPVRRKLLGAAAVVMLAWVAACGGGDGYGGGGGGGGNTAAPTITTQPQNVTVNIGQTATFSVIATNASTYQWRRDGANIMGATGASHTTAPTTAADNGAVFSVVVSNSYGSTTSNNAALTVQ